MPGEASPSPGAARVRLLLAAATACQLVADLLRDGGFSDTAEKRVRESDALIIWATELADAIREL